MAKAKVQTFAVRPLRSVPEGARLVRGTLPEVKAFLLAEIDIQPATVDQAVELGRDGVEIESAGPAA